MLYFCLYSFSDVFFYFVFSFVFIFLVLIKSSGAAFTHPVHFLTSKNKKKTKRIPYVVIHSLSPFAMSSFSERNAIRNTQKRERNPIRSG